MTEDRVCGREMRDTSRTLWWSWRPRSSWCAGRPSSSLAFAGRPRSDCAAARHESEHDDHDGDDEQRVNEIASSMHRHTASPAEQEDEDDDHENEIGHVGRR